MGYQHLSFYVNWEFIMQVPGQGPVPGTDPESRIQDCVCECVGHHCGLPELYATWDHVNKCRIGISAFAQCGVRAGVSVHPCPVSGRQPLQFWPVLCRQYWLMSSKCPQAGLWGLVVRPATRQWWVERVWVAYWAAKQIPTSLELRAPHG